MAIDVGGHLGISRKLGVRVVFIVIFLVIFSAAISSIILLSTEKKRIYSKYQEQISQFAYTVSLCSQQSIINKEYGLLTEIYAQLIAKNPWVLYGIVTDPQGIKVFSYPKDAGEDKLYQSLPQSLFLVNKETFYELRNDKGVPTITEVITPIVVKGENYGLLRMGFSRIPFQREWMRMFWLEIILDIILIVLGLIILGIAMAISGKPIKLLERQSQRDGLTGLFNHTSFQRILDIALLHAQENKIPLAVLLLDVDDFKKVNDTFGHMEGDRILQVIAHIIKTSIRKSDFAARYGGEEFVICLIGCKSDEAIAIAEDIRTKVIHDGEHYYDKQKSKHVTLSIGISVFPDTAADKQTLISKADEQLYKAKHQGKNRISCL